MVDVNLELPIEETIFKTYRAVKTYTLPTGNYTYPVNFKINVPTGRTIKINLDIQVDEVI